MSSHTEIADALGRARMAETLGVGRTAVSNAVVRQRFPSSWFLILQGMCAERGIECPPGLFDMRLPDSSQFVDSLAESQETVSEKRSNPVIGA